MAEGSLGLHPVAWLRRQRHGRLKKFGPLFYRMGQLYRGTLRLLGIKGTVSHFIGPYGPFNLNGEFTFSDFAGWGAGHNNGFRASVEACKDAACVLDIGAHIGLVAMPMSQQVAPGGKVFAFEPATANRSHLEDHLRKNHIDNVEVVPVLIGGESKDSVPFFEQTGVTGQNSIVVKKNHAAYAEMSRPQMTLDEFCEKRGLKPDVIKIDVEGAEIGVLRGAQKTLSTCKPKIFLSVHPVEISLTGATIADLESAIDAIGYRSSEIDGQPVTSFRLSEYLLEPKDEYA